MVREFRMDEVPGGQGPVGVEGFPFGSGKVMDAIHDEGGLILRRGLFLVHEVDDPSFPVGVREEDSPYPSGNEAFLIVRSPFPNPGGILLERLLSGPRRRARSSSSGWQIGSLPLPFLHRFLPERPFLLFHWLPRVLKRSPVAAFSPAVFFNSWKNSSSLTSRRWLSRRPPMLVM